jgi:hypothetical protein
MEIVISYSFGKKVDVAIKENAAQVRASMKRVLAVL